MYITFRGAAADQLLGRLPGSRERSGHHDDKLSIGKKLVPKKGLEPPHPCEYMDLNHARLPIPPLRHDTIQRDRLDRQQPLVYKSRLRCQTVV